MADFDLNLMRVLMVLLEERSVSRAAERLYLTQSAVSKQLAKLREQFDDPLFVRHSGRLIPTPRIRDLEPQLRRWLIATDELTEQHGFKPESSYRRFRCLLNEECFATFLLNFYAPVTNKAPNIRLETSRWDRDSVNALARGDFDIGIMARDNDPRSPADLHVNQIPDSLNWIELAKDDHVCFLRKGHPVLEKEWNLENWLALTHLNIEGEGSENWLLHRALALMGKQIERSTMTSGFLSAALLCQHSDLVFVSTRSFAEVVAESHQLSIMPLPFALEPVSYLLAWPNYLETDPAHSWLREQICDAVREKQLIYAD